MQTILFKNTIIIIVGYKWKRSHIGELLCLRKTNNTLQLPVFFFSFFFLLFWQPYPGFRNCKSAFLILKMADWGGEFSFFQDIYVRIDIRIDISISIRSMTTKFGKQVHVGELTQMRLIEVTNLEQLLPIMLLYPLVTWPFEITWQTINTISPLPQCLWQPNLAGW